MNLRRSIEDFREEVERARLTGRCMACDAPTKLMRCVRRASDTPRCALTRSACGTINHCTRRFARNVRGAKMSDQDWRYQQRWVKQYEAGHREKARGPQQLRVVRLHSDFHRLIACGTKTTRKAATEAADLFWRCR